jgi:hypothetical protein
MLEVSEQIQFDPVLIPDLRLKFHGHRPSGDSRLFDNGNRCTRTLFVAGMTRIIHTKPSPAQPVGLATVIQLTRNNLNTDQITLNQTVGITMDTTSRGGLRYRPTTVLTSLRCRTPSSWWRGGAF